MFSKEKIVHSIEDIFSNIEIGHILKIIAYPKLSHTIIVQVTDFKIFHYDNHITFYGLCLLTCEPIQFRKRDIMENYGPFTIEEFIEKYPERLI